MCFVPDRKTMDLRQLVRHRMMLVRTRTKLKNKIYQRLIDSLNAEIIAEKILSYMKEDETNKLLETIPGIGYYSAVLIVSDIGDINGFPDSNHLCSYAGLIPSTHSSGGITYHRAITKSESKHLRWIMLDCVHSHIRTDKNSNIILHYRRLSKSKGNSKAAAAAASKLLKVVYWVLKDRRKYVSLT